MKLDDLPHTRWARWLGFGVAGVVLLWALAWLLGPGVLKNQLEIRLTSQLGRKVSVGRVDLRPWSLELTVDDLAIAHADKADATPQVSIKRLYMDMELQSLLRWAPVVDAVAVDGPQLRLKYLGDGHYDVDDVLARLNHPSDLPPTKPLGFALHNLALSEGQVQLEDAPAGKVHLLTGLTIKLPFLSNLESKRDIQIQPQLAFKLDGSAFDLSAQGTPFALNRKTDIQVKLHDLNLAPYLAHWPTTLPLRLTSAVLDADVKLAFAQSPSTSLVLSGWVNASQVRLVDPTSGAAGGREMLAFESLRIPLVDVRPLEHQVQLGQVTWTKPMVAVQRNASGAIDWQTLLAGPKLPTSTIKDVAASEVKTGATAENNQNSSAWKLTVQQFDMKDGEIRWQDGALPQPARLVATAIQLSAHEVQWPLQQSVPFDGVAKLGPANLTFQGSATDQAAQLTVKVADAPLSLVKAYMGKVLAPQLEGILNAEMALNWQAAKSAQQTMQLALRVPMLTLDKLALTQPSVKQPLGSLGQLQLTQGDVDLTNHTATVGQLRLSQPKLSVARTSDGHWMFEDWLHATPKPANQVADAAQKPWQLSLGELGVTHGDIRFADATTPKRVVFGLSGVTMKVKNFASSGSKPFSWQVSARMQHGHTEPGTLSARGMAGLNPMVAQADIVAQRLPLHALEPYLSSYLNVTVLRADTSFKGGVNLAQKPQGLALRVHGDTLLEDFRADSLATAQPVAPAEELLRWKDLRISGLDLAMAPGAATRLDVAQTSLTDFYAKLTLNEAGRFNLQDVLVSSSGNAASAAGVTAQPILTEASTPVAQNAIKKEAEIALSARAEAKNNVQVLPEPAIHFGPITLAGGRVDFTDHFIKPNYSAHLSELNGKLGAFASQNGSAEVQLADLQLRGRAEGTASLEIAGKINPLANPLALDIAGHVRDLELAPLSTYAVHYAGYGIERGKLSMDVAYKVQPDGQLTASNQLVLNQLRFGDEVPGAPHSLPVKLAVALLADRDGVIDINLPVSGSINDPQFRVGSIVFKLIVNLIAKAVTSPFSLLASAFGGGGDELNMVSFAPGSAVLSSEARAGLDKVAHALAQRPVLKMTVVGTASLEAEREAFKREQLQALVLAEKVRASPELAHGEPAAVTAQEYPALLKTVYKRGNFPKPRNLIGMTKDLPVPDMEALMLANLPATDASMQDLALQRGVAVRDYLASQHLPPERLFLGAAKTLAPAAYWQPQAQLHLSTQ